MKEENLMSAVTVGNNPVLLEKFLREAKSKLPAKFKFLKWEFDFPDRCLLGYNRFGNAVYRIQWMLRDDPTSPISDTNLQPDRGVARLFRVNYEDDQIKHTD